MRQHWNGDPLLKYHKFSSRPEQAIPNLRHFSDILSDRHSVEGASCAPALPRLAVGARRIGPCVKPTIHRLRRQCFLFTFSLPRPKTERSVSPTTLRRRAPMTFSRHHSSTVCLTSPYNELNAFHSSCFKNTGHMTYSQLHKISTSFITLLKRRVPTMLNTKCFRYQTCAHSRCKGCQ